MNQLMRRMEFCKLHGNHASHIEQQMAEGRVALHKVSHCVVLIDSHLPFSG